MEEQVRDLLLVPLDKVLGRFLQQGGEEISDRLSDEVPLNLVAAFLLIVIEHFQHFIYDDLERLGDLIVSSVSEVTTDQ